MSHNDVRWYLEDGDDAARTLVQYVRSLREEQQYRHNQRLLHAALYGGSELYGFGPEYRTQLMNGPTDRLELNICRTMVDAVTAHIAARAQPRATIITDGATYATRKRALVMDQGIAGVNYSERANAKFRRTFRSATIFGESWVWIEADHVWGKPKISRTLPGEIVVDEDEAQDGEPRRIYRHRYYDRRVLMGIFPQHKEAILASNANNDMRAYGYDPSKDKVLVYEGWSMPSSPTAGDGRYLAALDGTCLEMLEWMRTYFPGSRFAWKEPEHGPYGVGLVEDLAPLQVRINDLLSQINKAHEIVAGKWMVEKGSGVNPNHINDERDGILMYVGAMPVYVTPNAIPPQMYEYLWRLKSEAYQITGISELAATAMKPAGLNSGVALRAYEENQSKRFSEVIQAYEDFSCDAAVKVVDALTDLAIEGDVRVRAITNGKLNEVDWRNNALDTNAFEIQVHPTSALRKSPAGLLAFVEDVAKTGAFEPQRLATLLSDIPDVKALVDGLDPTRELTVQMLATIVDSDGHDIPSPEPKMQLGRAFQIAQEEYLRYRASKVSEDALDGIDRWMSLCELLRAEAEKAAAMKAQGIDPNAPPALPEPTPQLPAPEGAPTGAPIQ